MESMVYMKKKDSDYEEIGIARDNIELWEDGLRTDYNTSEYEWWYFDCELEDGSKMAITYFTKPYTNSPKALEPFIRFNYSKADGTEVARTLNFKAEEFSAAKEKCDVKIGKNTFIGDLKDYTIHVEFEDYSFDISLKNDFKAWRPETGHFNFGTDYLAWLVPVPQGVVTAKITEAGNTKTVTGHGYHDHDWGMAPMREMIHHWYWGRAQVGPYLIITSCLYGEKHLNYESVGTFFAGKAGEILAKNGENMTLTISDIVTEPETEKPVPNTLLFEYKDSEQNYQLKLERKRDILHQRFHDEKNGAYLRFSGNSTLKVENKLETASYEKTAIWEEMYFGIPVKD